MNTLWSVLHGPTGRKCFISRYRSTLEQVLKSVGLSSKSKIPLLKSSHTTMSMRQLHLYTFQIIWKNKGESPYGPRPLVGCIEKRTIFFTSLNETNPPFQDHPHLVLVKDSSNRKQSLFCNPITRIIIHLNFVTTIKINFMYVWRAQQSWKLGHFLPSSFGL